PAVVARRLVAGSLLGPVQTPLADLLAAAPGRLQPGLPGEASGPGGVEEDLGGYDITPRRDRDVVLPSGSAVQLRRPAGAGARLPGETTELHIEQAVGGQTIEMMGGYLS